MNKEPAEAVELGLLPRGGYFSKHSWSSSATEVSVCLEKGRQHTGAVRLAHGPPAWPAEGAQARSPLNASVEAPRWDPRAGNHRGRNSPRQAGAPLGMPWAVSSYLFQDS